MAQILVAEDEYHIRNLVRIALNLHKFSPILVKNGAEAVEAAQDMYDLFILDINMPRMNGIEAAHEIRSLPSHAETPILFLSGNEKYYDASQINNCTMLTKPFTITDLIDHIQSILAE